MQVRIGVKAVPKELVVETNMTADEVEQALAEALGSGEQVQEVIARLEGDDMTDDEVEQQWGQALALSSGVRIFRLTDKNGGRILVPADKVGYVEIGESESPRVGFGTI